MSDWLTVPLGILIALLALRFLLRGTLEPLRDGAGRGRERLPRSCRCGIPPVPVQLLTGETVAWLCPTCLAKVPAPQRIPIPPKGPGGGSHGVLRAHARQHADAPCKVCQDLIAHTERTP